MHPAVLFKVPLPSFFSMVCEIIHHTPSDEYGKYLKLVYDDVDVTNDWTIDEFMLAIRDAIKFKAPLESLTVAVHLGVRKFGIELLSNCFECLSRFLGMSYFETVDETIITNTLDMGMLALQLSELSVDEYNKCEVWDCFSFTPSKYFRFGHLRILERYDDFINFAEEEFKQTAVPLTDSIIADLEIVSGKLVKYSNSKSADEFAFVNRPCVEDAHVFNLDDCPLKEMLSRLSYCVHILIRFPQQNQKAQLVMSYLITNNVKFLVDTGAPTSEILEIAGPKSLSEHIADHLCTTTLIDQFFIDVAPLSTRQFIRILKLRGMYQNCPFPLPKARCDDERVFEFIRFHRLWRPQSYDDMLQVLEEFPDYVDWVTEKMCYVLRSQQINSHFSPSPMRRSTI